MRGQGGRQIRIETASKESYAATGGFYERLGFRVDGRLRDFYAEGDDLLIFYKSFGAEPVRARGGDLG
jgi:ribosomal protein S18 acetylase RimI-like enzyme